MAQDNNEASEISLEETNKIRLSLGLKPIPPPEATTNNESKTAAPDGDSMSVEETNKLRASLGLKPIPVGDKPQAEGASTSYVDQDAQARANWEKLNSAGRKLEDEERKRKEADKLEERTERNKKLEGSTLGAQDGNSTKSWLQNLRQKVHEGGDQTTSKKVAKKKSNASYDTTDLKGMKVSHKMSEIQSEHDDVILTLKDSSVLDDEDGIQLESTELNEKKKLKEKLRAKKGLKATSDEEDSDGEFKAKNVLSKYDSVVDGDDTFSGFTLDGESLKQTPVREKPTLKDQTKVKEDLEFDVQAIVSGGFDSGDITGDLGGDYQEAKPAKFKKPKIKKKKSTQSISKKRSRDNDDEEDGEDIVMENEVDDDFNLQAALNANRRKAQKLQIKRSKIMTDEELAAQIESEKNEEESEVQNGMVISSTTDFLSAIKQQALNNSQEQKSKPRTRRDDSPTPEPEPVPEIPVEPVEPMEIDETVEVEEDPNVQEELAATGPVDASSIAPDEPTLSGGLGDALKLLRSHGVLKREDEQGQAEAQRKSEQREWSRKMAQERVQRDLELARKRERDRASGKYDNMSQKDREELAQQENRNREIQEAREAQRRFANYKPNIHLEYRDDSGRVLSQKDAYKHLSHQFHGKGPGKGKVEKQLKKDEEEKKMMAQSIFGNSDGSSKRCSGAAGVRLQ